MCFGFSLQHHDQFLPRLIVLRQLVMLEPINPGHCVNVHPHGSTRPHERCVPPRDQEGSREQPVWIPCTAANVSDQVDETAWEYDRGPPRSFPTGTLGSFEAGLAPRDPSYPHLELCKAPLRVVESD